MIESKAVILIVAGMFIGANNIMIWNRTSKNGWDVFDLLGFLGSMMLAIAVLFVGLSMAISQ
jgi:intracellular septation protein A